VYFTDRGIEELGEPRGEDHVTFAWLAARLRPSSACIPASTSPSAGWPPGWPAPNDEDDEP
jgi:hypothetical protein